MGSSDCSRGHSKIGNLGNDEALFRGRILFA